jgi:hypothetical protein
MRNLLGRLHARPPGELARIAAFWRVAGGRGDDHPQVGAVYRVLTDPRAVRSAWDDLASDERELVRLLAIGTSDEAAPTLAELADRLGRPEPDVRATAIRLYHVGILAREGDDDPLPVGAAARLFLPRELALLFRRIQDEIEAGDLSETPLRALLEWLDDTEIEESATIWGLMIVPGLRQRAEIMRQILRQVGDPQRVAAVSAGRRRDAAAIWRRVRDEPGGRPVPLADAAAAAGLAGDDPRSGHRLRLALAELESALLVWHTYRRDGSRWLFVPAEIRAPRPPPAPELPPLALVAEPAVTPPGWRHPDALAWDLLTLLRELADPSAPPWPATGDPPRPRLRRLNPRLWHRGSDVPPAAYLDFLIALAEVEGLLAQHGDDHHPTLMTTAAARGWRNQSFPAQSERLRWWWLASPHWLEGRARDDVEVWGADWRGARRKVVTLLAEPAIGLEPGTWYTLESVTSRVAAHDPNVLGSTFTAATARQAAGDDGRAAATAEVVAIELGTAMAWFGLIEVATIPGHGGAVRLTGAGRAVSLKSPIPAIDTPPGPPLVVSASGEIALHDPSPIRVWALSAFADLVGLDRVSRYQLSAEGLARALAAGFDLNQVLAFLTRQGGAPLPEEVADQLAAWALGYRRVRLQQAVIVTPDDPAALPEIARLLEQAGITSRALGTDALLVEPPSGEPEDDPSDVLASLLRTAGYAPQLGKASSPAGKASPDRPSASGPTGGDG